MAGTYPDVPGPRIAWESDGTVAYYMPSTVASSITSDQYGAPNDETNASGAWTSWGGNTGKWGLVFPNLMDVVGIRAEVSVASGEWTINLETSANCTSLDNGNWSAAGSIPAYNSSDKVGWRNNITTVSLSGIRGLRGIFTAAGSAISTFHVYGRPSTGQNPDRLRFWHPTLDQELGGAAFDFGDMIANHVKTIQYRVKNNSATLTANTVLVSSTALTSSSLGSGITFSGDGGSTYGTATGNRTIAASIAPGAISAIRHMRATMPASPTAGLGRTTIRVAASTWT